MRIVAEPKADCAAPDMQRPMYTVHPTNVNLLCDSSKLTALDLMCNIQCITGTVCFELSSVNLVTFTPRSLQVVRKLLPLFLLCVCNSFKTTLQRHNKERDKSSLRTSALLGDKVTSLFIHL